MILIGECCGPCAGGGGGGGGGPARDRITVAGGLTASEAVGQFTITVRRVSATGGSGVVRVRWNSYGAACGCPHMIPTSSGTLTWGDMDTGDKTVILTLIAHGPPVFYTCPGEPLGGEVGRLTLTHLQGDADVDSPWALSAVCTHADPYPGFQPFVTVPRYSYYVGTHQLHSAAYGFLQVLPAPYWDLRPGSLSGLRGYGRAKTEYFQPAGAGGASMGWFARIFNDVGIETGFENSSPPLPPGGPPPGWPVTPIWNRTAWTETMISETLTNDFSAFGWPVGTKREFTLTDGPFPYSLTVSDGKMADAESRFEDRGGAVIRSAADFGNIGGQPPIGAPPDTSYDGGVSYNGWDSPIGANRQAGRWISAIMNGSGVPLNVTVQSVKVDARGRAAGAPYPVKVEINVLTYHYTNQAQTAWVAAGETGWHEITDTFEWVRPPAAHGFKQILHRTTPLDAFYCHPGYIP